jgi:4-hydroxy-3-methylbut-2-enyl diphosphate reductase
MEIILVPKIGFCFGVKRAVDISVETFKKKPRPCQVLGPLVHNEFVIEELRKKGIKFINSLDRVESGTVIIPAHGEDPKVLEKIKKRGLGLVDATCPLVTKVQNLAKIINNKGHQVIIIGDRNHKEVKSIQAAISGRGIIIPDVKEIPRLKIKGKSVGVLTQTTQNPEKVKNILKKLKNKFKNLKFYNTLCPTVQSYQAEVKKLAPEVDLMLIVGSKNSANTKRLVEIAKEKQRQVHYIENAKELKKGWLLGIKKVGIAGGTSTPDWLIKKVIKKLKSMPRKK